VFCWLTGNKLAVDIINRDCCIETITNCDKSCYWCRVAGSHHQHGTSHFPAIISNNTAGMPCCLNYLTVMMKALQFFEILGVTDPLTQHKSQKTEIFWNRCDVHVSMFGYSVIKMAITWSLSRTVIVTQKSRMHGAAYFIQIICCDSE
jgi:hypothetical protein